MSSRHTMANCLCDMDFAVPQGPDNKDRDFFTHELGPSKVKNGTCPLLTIRK